MQQLVREKKLKSSGWLWAISKIIPEKGAIRKSDFAFIRITHQLKLSSVGGKYFLRCISRAIDQ